MRRNANRIIASQLLASSLPSYYNGPAIAEKMSFLSSKNFMSIIAIKNGKIGKDLMLTYSGILHVKNFVI